MAKEINYETLQASLRMIEKKGEMAFENAREEGTLDARTEKLYMLSKDQEVKDKLGDAQTLKEAQAVFAEYGLDMTVEEVAQLGDQIVQIHDKLYENNGEISEEELELIAGGGMLAFIGGIGAAIATDLAKDYLKKAYKWVDKRIEAIEFVVIDPMDTGITKAVSKGLAEVIKRT